MPYSRNGKRDYKKEYEKYHASEEQKENRAARNGARRQMEREGRVSKGDGKDVDHKTPLKRGGGNGRKNLRVQERSTNRSVAKTKGNRMKGNG